MITEFDLLALLDTTFLKGVSRFDEIDSTNTRAIALVCTDNDAALKTPHLVFAERQTSGRGRGSNQWWSAAGSLTFSLIVDCQALGLSSEQQPLLPLITGMALLRSGQSVLSQHDFSVKWPNDVFLNGRKLAGILAEVPSPSWRTTTSDQSRPRQSQQSDASCSGRNRQPRFVVIGVGFNINNRFADASEALRSTGISLSDASGQTYDRVEILKTFLEHLERLIQSLANGESVLENWPTFCLLTGKQVTLQTGSSSITGLCHGIDSSGALLLETQTRTQRYLGGEVKSWS